MDDYRSRKRGYGNLNYYPGRIAAAPDGSQEAFSNGGTISQVLSSTLTNNTVYTLSVYVGQRTDDSTINYTIELIAGTSVLASVNNPVNPSPGNWGLATLSYNSGLSNINAGQQLGIKLINNNNVQPNQVDFDEVTLTATTSTALVSVPLPSAALWVLGSVLAGFIGFYGRKTIQQ